MLERQLREYGRSRRRLFATKVWGANFREGYHEYEIAQGGTIRASVGMGIRACQRSSVLAEFKESFMNHEEAILLVEDNEDDVFFMTRALKGAAISNPLFVAEDGQKAIDYFSGVGGFSDRAKFPIPNLVFLDLKLPGKKGLEVLSWLRQQEPLRSVVVVVLTTSQEPSDLRRAYRLGANSYLVKPATTERLGELVRAVKAYWIEFNVFDSLVF